MRSRLLVDRAARLLQRNLRRLRRVERRLVTLHPQGPPRGRALVSYIVDPYLLPAGAPLPHSHTNFWESRAIGEVLRDLGFTVDAIHWTNRAFVPRRPYDLLVDVRLNLERLAPLVGERCLKVMHAETSHRTFHNPAQKRRLDDLERRRGVRLTVRRPLEDNRTIESADCATVLGNEVTQATYAHAGKPLWRVPISQPVFFPFPADRDWPTAARHFLWFGSGGMVHKGLDIVLEAFAGLPDHQLTVVGPVERERDFEKVYEAELYRTPNVRCVGWVDIAGERFREITRSAAGLVYPSCSEGCSGSAVTCMHAGLIPLLTPQTGVDVDPAYGILLADPSPESIRRHVTALSARPASDLAAMARRAWEHARAHHTREEFARRYRLAMEEILAIFRPELVSPPSTPPPGPSARHGTRG
jgi:glycosyltransferase involved in cell wall biosynthesis